MKTLTLVFLAYFYLSTPQDAKPLPELNTFLAEFRKTLHSDGLLLSRYTYTLKDTRTELHSDNRVRKTDVRVFEVFPGAEPWQTHRRLISMNGVPLSAAEIAKRDREQERNVESQKRKLRKKTPQQIEEARAKEQREDNEIIQDLFNMYDVKLLRRDTIDDHPAMRLSFAPKPGFKPKTSEGKMWQHISGEVWVSESDHELIRVSAEFTDFVTVSIGLGMRARAPKGSRIFAERRKLNNEAWLPARIEGLAASGRPGGISVRQVVEYYDHKKYTVDTIIRIPEPQH